MKMFDEINFDENDIEYAMDMYSDIEDSDDIDDIESIEIDDNDDDLSDEEKLISQYKAVNLTTKYLNILLEQLESNRDLIKFYYNDELICGKVIGKFPSSDKYIFLTTNLQTGEESKRSLSFNLIENY